MSGKITDQEFKDITIVDSYIPTSDTGKPSILLSGLANMIKNITGESNWRTTPIKSIGSHLSETVITANKTINVPADYPTIQEALDSIKYAWIPRDVAVTIQVAAGTYNHTSPIIFDHPCGRYIKIVGATPVTTTCSAVGTITGVAGDWSVPITVASTSGIAAGDYVIIKDTTGTDDHYAFRGIWKVISVDNATQITVQNTHRKSTFPTASLSGGTVVVLKTILKFDGSGLIIEPNTALGFINNIALVGNGTNGNGLCVGNSSEYGNWGPSFILCGENFGVNNFGWTGVAVIGSSILQSVPSSVIASCGNGHRGFLASHCSAIIAPSSVSNGNSNSGFQAIGNSRIDVDSSVACGNNGFGYDASEVSSIKGSYAIANNNNNAGFNCSVNSGISVPNSTAYGNTNYDYHVWVESSMYVYGYTGTPTFSPALSTVGNVNSIIST